METAKIQTDALPAIRNTRVMPLPQTPKKPKPYNPLERKEPTNRERSIVQEERVAKAFKGKRQKGSGAVKFYRGDVVADRYLVEAKTTKRKSFTLTRFLLAKIEREAFAVGKKPALVVSWERQGERVNADTMATSDWAVIPLKLLEALLDETE